MLSIWLMFANPVVNRFCSLTFYADIVMLQILNAIERKKGQLKTSVQTVKNGNSKSTETADVVFKTLRTKEAQFCSALNSLLRRIFFIHRAN